jgi:Lrp/AsnC family transcriptional regulator for asnA, asnC and gidA
MLFVQSELKSAPKRAQIGMNRMSSIDETDARILELLEEDARRSFTEIAEKLNVSESAIRKRVSALQRKGVIKKFTIKMDHAKLGLNTVAIVGVDVDSEKMLGIAQQLCDFKEVKCVATSSGDHMIMLEVWAKNGKDLNKLISNRIFTLEGVKRVCPALILEKLKD